MEVGATAIRRILGHIDACLSIRISSEPATTQRECTYSSRHSPVADDCTLRRRQARQANGYRRIHPQALLHTGIEEFQLRQSLHRNVLLRRAGGSNLPHQIVHHPGILQKKVSEPTEKSCGRLGACDHKDVCIPMMSKVVKL